MEQAARDIVLLGKGQRRLSFDGAPFCRRETDNKWSAYFVFNSLVSSAVLRLGRHVTLIDASFFGRVALGEEEGGSLTTTKLSYALIHRVCNVILEDGRLVRVRQLKVSFGVLFDGGGAESYLLSLPNAMHPCDGLDLQAGVEKRLDKKDLQVD